MMKSGLKPTRIDHRDYDFHKTFGTVAPAILPEHYTTDPNLWNPNQMLENTLFTPTVPALPWGCTDYGTTDSRVDQDGVLHSPMDMENVTHANARQGIDMREAVSAAVKVFGYSAYFNIRASYPIDWFDAVRLSMLSTKSEKRCAIVGTPFYPEFLTAGTVLDTPDINGVVPMPSDWSLSRATWHCWNVKGWTTLNHTPYLICKPWVGHAILMDRATFNALMDIKGSCAFTLSKIVPGTPQTIDLSVVQMIVSFIRNLFNV